MTVPSYSYDLVGAGSTAQTAIALGKALPIGRDLEIDPLTGDLLLRGGDLRLVRDLAAIRQEVATRLQFLRGEWFLDKTAGVPYLQNILVKAPDLAAIKSIFRTEILACVGVASINSLEATVDSSTRVLSVVWSATTDLGELIPETEVVI